MTARVYQNSQDSQDSQNPVYKFLWLAYLMLATIGSCDNPGWV